MKYLILLFVFSLSATGVAQEQSDYLIVKSFQEKALSLRTAIAQATSLQDCIADSARIVELESQFSSDTVLLNNALYPDDYGQTIASLYNRLVIARQRIGSIESEASQISDLQLQLSQLSTRIDSLARENDKLMASLDVMSKAMEKDTRTMDSLRRVVFILQRGLRERDAAIFALTDSLFAPYGNNVASLPEQQKRMLVGRLERHDVVSNIRGAAEQNLKLVESAQLGKRDLVNMVKEQQDFSARWKAFGPRLAGLYFSRREKEGEIKRVESVISEWGDRADSALWASLNEEFTKQEVQLQPFNSADEFVSSLSSYFDTEGGDSTASSADKAARLHHFLENVWNPSVGTQWVPLLVSNGMISQDQQSQLQTKLTTWENSAKPSYTLLYIIIAIAVVLLVVILLTRRRKRPQRPEEPHPTIEM